MMEDKSVYLILLCIIFPILIPIGLVVGLIMIIIKDRKEVAEALKEVIKDPFPENTKRAKSSNDAPLSILDLFN